MSYWTISRYIGHVLLTLLVAAVAVNAGFGAWEAYLRGDEAYRQQQNQAKSETEKIADKIADECQVDVKSSPAFRECLAKQIWTYQKQDNIDQDLQAQQDMSLWGFWTVIVGAVSLAIGFGGLVALFLSLRQTRQAITNDRRIGEAQTRAYIAVEPQTDLPPVDISPEGIPELGIVVRNVGNSPARNVRHIAFAGKLPAHLPVPCNDLVRPIDGAVLRATDILTGDRTVLSVDSELSWNDIVLLADPGGETRYGIAGIIWYDDVFDSHYVRRFCYHVDLKFDRKTTNVKGMALVQMGFSVANSHNDEVKRD